MGISIFPTPSSVTPYSRFDMITTSTTWAHPDGYASPRSVKVIIMGGGGGGGAGGAWSSIGSGNSLACGGAGGGSGFVTVGEYIVTTDTVVTIGSGGAGGESVVTTGSGSTQGNSGNTGGTTYFGNLSAPGGGGGSGGRVSTDTTYNTYSSGGSGGSGGGNVYTRADAVTQFTNNIAGASYGRAVYNEQQQSIPRMAQGQNGSAALIGNPSIGQVINGLNQINVYATWISGGGSAAASGRYHASAYTAPGAGVGGDGFNIGGSSGTSTYTLSTSPATGVAGGTPTYSGGGGGGGFAAASGSATCTSGAGGAGGAGLVIVYY
jgi:hypothetical protein